MSGKALLEIRFFQGPASKDRDCRLRRFDSVISDAHSRLSGRKLRNDRVALAF